MDQLNPEEQQPMLRLLVEQQADDRTLCDNFLPSFIYALTFMLSGSILVNRRSLPGRFDTFFHDLTSTTPL
ncbi:hypothetical protein BON22_1830 [Cyberlindnera fabianii]|uniref:Uncharacterized protein n=1 Tax=Cyberlindnera fabianii TaxID=36022 RepID=A0A1V2L8F4_CYBFA|nr:hypothetical protein BON22_1830 [Cyberlindnera fabianii]